MRYGTVGTILMVVLAVIMLMVFFLYVDFVVLSLSEPIRTDRVKCIDVRGAEFEDEWCTKEIRCSYLYNLFKWEGCGE